MKQRFRIYPASRFGLTKTWLACLLACLLFNFILLKKEKNNLSKKFYPQNIMLNYSYLALIKLYSVCFDQQIKITINLNTNEQF
ncbi:hypothetical protein D0C36_23530 [Mucilaginibacter conchicola]|uniref:Uncharacterized protein n=1 Tax=Mucilaginibacter conchicola TaxID=2303333 RepID=A0A372NM17_9SPHI|nr:hypothetical protein D0C36_23530 [Mucilaginibacter conchicola]